MKSLIPFMTLMLLAITAIAETGNGEVGSVGEPSDIQSLPGKYIVSTYKGRNTHGNCTVEIHHKAGRLIEIIMSPILKKEKGVADTKMSQWQTDSDKMRVSFLDYTQSEIMPLKSCFLARACNEQKDSPTSLEIHRKILHPGEWGHLNTDAKFKIQKKNGKFVAFQMSASETEKMFYLKAERAYQMSCTDLVPVP